MKTVFKQQYLQKFDLKWKKISNFHALEIAYCGKD